MVSVHLIITFVALSSISAARHCRNITVSVNISAQNGIFDVPKPTNNVDVANFVLDLSQEGANYTGATLKGYATIAGSYNLSATFCRPSHGNSSVVQVLTHGLGFGKSYWDLPYNGHNYSYVAAVVDALGHSTFAWDRLGIGMSQHADPISVVQGPLELAALTAVTDMLRENRIPGSRTNFSKVVHVGHSFGSLLSYALTAAYPNKSDALVLTGFSQNGSFQPIFNLGAGYLSAPNLPTFSHKYSDGYLAVGNPTGLQNNFFAPGDFEAGIFHAAYAAGEPITMGEALTTGSITGSINNFSGPVLVVTGARDIPFCGGNCLATGDPSIASIPAAAKKFFPVASTFETFTVPGAGHGLNLQFSHTVTYSRVKSFLQQYI